MCGIYGLVKRGEGDCSGPVLEALRRLEYRGYDSAGIAVLTGNGMTVRKRGGRLARLAGALGRPLVGTAAIGHTRWATHGAPTDRNAHPHRDCDGKLAVVHNGIVENFRALRERLQRDGHRFASETDTEVIAHLIERERSRGVPLAEAVRRTLRHIRGTYALAVVDAGSPGELVAARNSSPLIVGVAEGAAYVASDAAALLVHTRRVVYLQDGQIARLTPGNLRVMRGDGSAVRHRSDELPWSADEASKGGWPHFMAKEIYEEADAVRSACAGRLSPSGAVKLGGLESVLPRLERTERVTLTACGTAYHAALIGAYLMQEYAGADARAELASELRYRRWARQDTSALFAVSQSGETADTLGALEHARAHGHLTCGIVNVVGSSIARMTDAGVYTHSGPEIGVASTKAFTGQVAALLLATLMLGRARGALSAGRARDIARALSRAPAQMDTLFARRRSVERAARTLARADHALFLGRWLSYPVALEGALKLKEVSYVHAEGYGAGEMKHGPIALVDRNMPVVVVAPRDRVYEKTLSNIQEVKARGGRVIAVGTAGDRHLQGLADAFIGIPRTHEAVAPLLATVPLHWMAYRAGVLRGKDVDKPRNLAKSVTVE
ncbi:MAG TPA: glutamine--fructose-6-phosphate transaminase (isomerizing) [Candidatus Paceibacterota bacterium]|nr:glutamine--fructose-6-phosphate transaminase (isomerizing) [Candidatus Paceibacterota bacterium]